MLRTTPRPVCQVRVALRWQTFLAPGQGRFFAPKILNGRIYQADRLAHEPLCQGPASLQSREPLPSRSQGLSSTKGGQGKSRRIIQEPQRAQLRPEAQAGWQCGIIYRADCRIDESAARFACGLDPESEPPKPPIGQERSLLSFPRARGWIEDVAERPTT